MKGSPKLLCLLVALLPIAAPAPARAATGLLMARFDNEPLAIEKGDYDPSDAWMGTLQITVRNAAPKPICYAEFTLEMSGFQVSGETMVMRLVYGDASIAETKRVSSDAKSLAPSKTAKLKVRSDKWSTMAAQMKRLGSPYHGNAVLKLRSVYFADGSHWQDGRLVS